MALEAFLGTEENGSAGKAGRVRLVGAKRKVEDAFCSISLCFDILVDILLYLIC